MNEPKKSRTLEKLTCAMYSGLAGLATGWTALGLTDISRHDPEQFRYTLAPLATTGILAASALAATAAYKGIAKLIKRFERQSEENNDHKDHRKKGLLFAAPLIGVGLAGAAYNHDAITAPHLDPAPLFDKIPEELTPRDPERKRNLRFLKHHLILPDLSELTNETIAEQERANKHDEGISPYTVPDASMPQKFRSTSIVEGSVGGTPAVKHVLADADGNTRSYLTFGDRTILLFDTAMAGHPDDGTNSYELFAHWADPRFPQGYHPTETIARNAKGHNKIIRIARNGTGQVIELYSKPISHANDPEIQKYLRRAVPHLHYANLSIRDLASREPLITLENVLISAHQERPQHIAGTTPPRITYVRKDGDTWRVHVINLETLENRPATAKDEIMWGDYGPIEAPR